MTKFVEVVCVLVCATAMLSASTATPSSSYREATITSVAKQQVTQPEYTGGDNPSDAPLQSQYFAYDIGVKTDCGTYVAHFESPYDYLSSAFAANREVPVRVSKHNLDFDLGYRDVQMRIVRQKIDRGASCSGVQK